MAGSAHVTDGLSLAATYERTVAASLERVWENVHDWEHLPSLHSAAFCDIALEEAGPWGWRARVETPHHEAPQKLVIELRREPDAERYHARTLEGPGTGADTITTLTPKGAHATHIHVEFWVPVPDPTHAEAIGLGMVALYTRLWDEDESMMVRRQAMLDGRAPRVARPGSREAVDLGPIDELRNRLPTIVDVDGDPVRVLDVNGELYAHTAVCPHLGGPLEEAEVQDGHVICPWHGYRFSLVDGSSPENPRCRLAIRPRVEAGSNGHARLLFS